MLEYKIPMTTTMTDRVRVNNLGLALVALAQGIPFFHAGDDLLRSKSFSISKISSGSGNRVLYSGCNAKQSQYDASTGTFTIPPRTTAVFLERQ